MNINTKENILLSVLHSAWCTHNDFQNLLNASSSLESIYKQLLQKNIFYKSIFWEKRFEKICALLPKFSLQEREEYLQKNNIFLVNIQEKNYPERLRNIYKIPTLLYTRGSIKNTTKSLWIVGTRKPTEYGKNVVKFAFDSLKNYDISIISGWAYGIDSIAHKFALQHGMYTISVFGSGIDIFYPNSHTSLFESILQGNWCLLSAFPLGTEPLSYNFPIRNEIVAGLSDTIFIPEAWVKSWTLITARLALELGKDVVAVPGDIFRDTSAGCNELISLWEAATFRDISDIAPEEYSHTISSENTLINKPSGIVMHKNFSSENSKQIFMAIFEWNNTLDSIIRFTSLPLEIISIEIAMLEIEGHIQLTPMGTYECSIS